MEVANPYILAMFVFLLGQLGVATGALIRMHSRLGIVEQTANRIDRATEEMRRDVVEAKTTQATLTAELRAHMAEEGRNVSRLETLLKTALQLDA